MIENDMKRLTLTIFIWYVAFGIGHAQDKDVPNGDIAYHFETIEQIIGTESQLTTQRDRATHYQEVWKNTRYFSLSYDATQFSSTNFPTLDATYESQYNNKIGVGLQLGKTFLFHKKPIGTFLFVGLDYTGMDLSYNSYGTSEAAPLYDMGTQKPFNLPWHNKKWTLDYGMSIGPSLTLYPFTALGNKGADKIRIHAYFRLGYHLGLLCVNDVVSLPKNVSENEMAWANGLSTDFGVNLTWDVIGLGYEVRKISSFTIHQIDKDFQTGQFTGRQLMSRFYIHIKF